MAEHKYEAQFTTVDLFAGAGGMSLGFSKAGFRPVWAVEADKWAAQTYQANSDAEVNCGDIREVTDFPVSDVVIGGPPCQGFSRLGKKARKPRPENHLWREYMRCIESTMPSMFVIENVADFFRDPAFTGVMRIGRGLGYRIVHGVLNAADFGVPQRRHRAILIGSRVGMPRMPEPTHRDPAQDVLFGDLPPWKTVRDAIGDLPLEANNLNRHDRREVGPLSLARYRAVPPGGNRKDIPEHLLPDCWRYKDPRGGGSADLMGRMKWDEPSLTIRTEFQKPEKGRYLHPAADRSITVREGARLQTFPDDYAFAGSNFQASRQIGNAVPVELARQIALTVRSQLIENGVVSVSAQMRLDEVG